MKCITCKEEINPKFKHAIMENTCPICGENLISKSDFVFRKSLINILKNNEILDEGKITNIVYEIHKLITNGEETPRINTVLEHREQINKVNVTVNDLEEINTIGEEVENISQEEEQEVNNMIESGEIVLSNVIMRKKEELAKKRGITNYVPKPISSV